MLGSLDCSDFLENGTPQQTTQVASTPYKKNAPHCGARLPA